MPAVVVPSSSRTAHGDEVSSADETDSSSSGTAHSNHGLLMALSLEQGPVADPETTTTTTTTTLQERSRMAVQLPSITGGTKRRDNNDRDGDSNHHTISHCHTFPSSQQLLLLRRQSSEEDARHNNDNANNNNNPRRSMIIPPPSNERLLGTAFFSFMAFALTELVFAVVAGSEAMMGDAAAMLVDSLTYLFNWVAERRKNRFDAMDVQHDDEQQQRNHHDNNNSDYSVFDVENTLSTAAAAAPSASPSDPMQFRTINNMINSKRNRRKMVLQLEIIPPVISVTTLVVVTGVVTTRAVRILRLDVHRSRDEQHLPNIHLMLAFSIFNLALDVMNVFCFARAKHLMGYAVVSTTEDQQQMEDDCPDECSSSMGGPAREASQRPATATSFSSCPENRVNHGRDDHHPSNENQQKPGYTQVPIVTATSHCLGGDDYGSEVDAVALGTCADHPPLPTNNRLQQFGGETLCNNSSSGGKECAGAALRHNSSFYSDHHRDHDNSSTVAATVAVATSRNSSGHEQQHANLNMCSAYTHVFADTLRSIAVIVAAGLAEVLPAVTPEEADATAAVVVSVLILLSLVPLTRGLWSSVAELRAILAAERSESAFKKRPRSASFEMT